MNRWKFNLAVGGFFSVLFFAVLTPAPPMLQEAEAQQPNLHQVFWTLGQQIEDSALTGECAGAVEQTNACVRTWFRIYNQRVQKLIEAAHAVPLSTADLEAAIKKPKNAAGMKEISIQVKILANKF